MFDSSGGVFAGAEEATNGGIGTDVPATVMYEFMRGDAGWMTRPFPPPPIAQFPVASMHQDGGPDLGSTLWKMRTPSQPEGEGDLYRRESDGSFVHMGPLQPPSTEPLFGEEGNYLGASQNFTHVLVQKDARQGRWPGDTTTAESESLYEYGGVEEPEPLLVAVKNDGRLASNTEAQLVSQCGAELGSGRAGSAYNAISATGAIVYFTALACGEPSVNEVYARVGEANTVAISEPTLPPGQCTGSCETAEHREGFFVGASEDGSKVLFTTEQPLLNNDKDTTNDLYMAELEGASVKRLHMVSEGETSGTSGENDQTPGEGANVAGVVRVAADGSRVYFVATGVLTAAANEFGVTAEAGADNLYVSDTGSGRTRFIGELSNEDSGLWARTLGGKQAAVAPDGGVLVLVARADLTGEGGVSGAQVYKYDTVSGSLARISIGQHSSLGNLAPKLVVQSYAGNDVPSRAHSALTMSKDGSYIFFESPDALTARALDDQVTGCFFEVGGTCFSKSFAANVYEYHEGKLSLIVTGRVSVGSAVLLSTDESGHDVFFTALEGIARSDTDTQQDIYDARVDGGFPFRSSPSCTGEACRALTGPPQLTSPGSVSQPGGDNLVSPLGVVVKTRSGPRTRARKLAAALKACRAKSRARRHGCEVAAKKRFGPKTKAKKSTRRVK